MLELGMDIAHLDVPMSIYDYLNSMMIEKCAFLHDSIQKLAENDFSECYEKAGRKLPVRVLVKFDKSFYIFAYLLKDYRITSFYMDSKWDIPAFEVEIDARNMELIKQIGLIGGTYSKKDNNWPLYWSEDSHLYETWKYIESNHPLFFFNRFSRLIGQLQSSANQNEKEKEISEEGRKLLKLYENTIEEYREKEYQFREKNYSEVKTKYTTFVNSKEVLLFFMIKKVFNDAIFQYKAQFLGNQSLDIYIPSKRTAIEYQGTQHFKNVEPWGGEKALAMRKQLDIRKQNLCKDEGIALVHWNYSEEVNGRKLADKLAYWFGGEPMDYQIKLSTNLYSGNNIYVKDLLESLAYYRFKIKINSENEDNQIQNVYAYRKYGLDGVFVQEYMSISEAASDVGVIPEIIRRACVGKQITAGGFQWRKELKATPIFDIASVSPKRNSKGEKRSVYQIDPDDGVIIKCFDSIAAASREIGVDNKSIRDVLKGKQKRAGGYFWDYADSKNDEE